MLDTAATEPRKPDALLLRRASKACFATGIYLVGSTIASIILMVAEVFSELSSGNLFSLNVSLSSFMVAIFLISCIGLFFYPLFGYYAFRIGGAYDSRALKTGGVILAVIPPLEVVTDAVSISNGTYTDGLSTISLAFLGPAFLVSLVLVGMLLVAYICLVIGASDMRNNTWVDSFNTAMILFILFFIPFVFPIGVIVFGSAIGRLASSREKRICPRCGKQIDPHALFCKFCGAELKQ